MAESGVSPVLNDLQAIAAQYVAHGLTCIPALPADKAAAVNWKPFQLDPPSERERNAMFSEPGLNIAVIGGSVSGNLMQIDAETPRSFDSQYERFYRAGLTNTWIDRSPSGGGHLWYKLPCAVRSRGVVNNVEIRAQNSYCLAPPSIAPSKVDGSLQPYVFQHKPPQILTVESLDQLAWLGLEKASLHVPFKAYPRKAQRLLDGQDRDRYESRSEHEHAIVVTMVNAGFLFEEILAAFDRYPAAGKFHYLEQTKDRHAAVSYLRASWNNARDWCIRESAARKNALDLLRYAQSIPWTGRSGSSLRTVFIAHCGLNYRSGGPTYHASVRDVAEVAGCDKDTAATATNKLVAAGAIKLLQESALNFGRRFELPQSKDLLWFQKVTREKRKGPKEKRDPLCVPDRENGKNTKFGTLTIPTREGVSQVSSFSSFLLPEAFRTRGLGKPAFECLLALNAGPLTCAQLAKKTGRHVQTIRTALKRLRSYGLAAKKGKLWRGVALEEIDLDDLTRAVSMKGAAAAQKERHRADRLRYKLRQRVKQHEQSEHGDS